MNKLIIALISLLFPILALAQNGDDGGALTFAPPATDYSVIFLGNLFGIVDGVLHGTGSQIMGAIFSVFNAAVLALGGIVIMYTLMVSTMNTAHEGQMLGQKWSSIWIPVRSTLGLALLIPKASGYCMMQIFVMWVVVQGIGAADKVWQAALSYLNRGGVIIQAQANPTLVLTNPSSSTSDVAVGASIILPAQVCMLGLQQALQNQRQSYLDLKQNNSGPCSGTPSAAMNTFCNTAVPDFLGTVNAVAAQTTATNNNKAATNFSVQMPNFDTAPYNALNGICGTLTWQSISALNNAISTDGSNPNQIVVTSAEMQTAQMSRAIAIQQMYLDLSLIAQIMVNNNPALSTTTNNNSSTNTPFSLVANQQFGVPYTANGSVCTLASNKCVTWGVSTGTSSGGALFNGTEFLGAIADYNGIMNPTLNLILQSNNAVNANASRLFITQAESQGWIMAGAYFFDLVKLNGMAAGMNSSILTDTNTGLTNSQFNASNILSPFGANNSCTGTYAILCQWFGGDKTNLNMVEALIDGSYLTATKGVPQPSTPVSPPNMAPVSSRAAIANLQSSTVYGFINNSAMVQLPGQPGLTPLQFSSVLNFTVDTTPLKLQPQNFECGRVRIIFFSFCLGQMFGDLFYNQIFLFLYNFFMQLFQNVINQVIMAFLMVPLQGMADIFKQGMAQLTIPGINPVIALANMGTMYINFAGNLWLMILGMSVMSALIPVFGIFIFALIALALPVVTAWVGIMLAIGFTTAYYIPILPYMIFTFGSIAWLIAVIEAMVAAPIVALGVTHPEGHDAFGKGEHAIMILMNIFLRPSMMIIGYIAGIALTYVGVWILNAGFDHAISFIQGGATPDTMGTKFYGFELGDETNASGSGSGGYTDWAGIFAFFFSILSYTMMYLIIVQRSFTLISVLPDKVLRWIGGQAESAGSEAAQWGDELKKKSEEAGGESAKAQGQIGQKLSGYGGKAVGGLTSAAGTSTKGKGSVSASGSSTPSKPE